MYPITKKQANKGGMVGYCEAATFIEKAGTWKIY